MEKDSKSRDKTQQRRMKKIRLSASNRKKVPRPGRGVSPDPPPANPPAKKNGTASSVARLVPRQRIRTSPTAAATPAAKASRKTAAVSFGFIRTHSFRSDSFGFPGVSMNE
jgi:hypothetical protein